MLLMLSRLMCSHDTSSYDFFFLLLWLFFEHYCSKVSFFYEYNFMFTKAVFFMSNTVKNVIL